MKVAGVILLCLLASSLVLAITVKPSNKQSTATAVENRVELTKTVEGERSVRYIPQSSPFIHLSPLSHHHHYEAQQQQRHHHHHHHSQLDNLNLVRYLQSLPKAVTAPQQIPSVAFLYAGNKHVSSPQVQAGFLYKAKANNGNKDSYPVSATMYPIYNRQSISTSSSSSSAENKHPVKYSPIYSQKPQTLTKVKQFTPFSPTNKIPGAWRAINVKQYYTKGSLYGDVQKEYVSPQIDYNSREEEFVPIMNPPYIKHMPTPAPPAYHYRNHYKINKIPLKPEKSITILNPAAAEAEADKPLLYVTTTTTTEKAILISTEQHSSSESSRPEYPYELEEQLIYELPGNESINVEHTSPRINYDHHENVEASLPELPYGPIELYKPQINFTQIEHVPNDFKYYKTVKINPNPEINSPQKDYYDKDIENDYDETVKDGSPRPNSGRPGIDFPIFHKIPETSFSCKEQRYKGFFGDVDTGCQVWHYCDLNGGKASFLCTNGTIFSQHTLTCDWWFNVKCSSTAQLYVLNERLYKYILPFTPKFPQDFQGPLVDKYIALKFKEMEEKIKKEKDEKAAQKEKDGESSEKQEEEEDPFNEDDDGGTIEGENELIEQVVLPEQQQHQQQIIESTTEAQQQQQQHFDSTENALTSTISYQHDEDLQSIEPHVEIKNVGASGHLTHSIDQS